MRSQAPALGARGRGWKLGLARGSLPSALPGLNFLPRSPQQGRDNCFANKRLLYLFPSFSSHSSSPPLSEMPAGLAACPQETGESNICPNSPNTRPTSRGGTWLRGDAVSPGREVAAPAAGTRGEPLVAALGAELIRRAGLREESAGRFPRAPAQRALPGFRFLAEGAAAAPTPAAPGRRPSSRGPRVLPPQAAVWDAVSFTAVWLWRLFRGHFLFCHPKGGSLEPGKQQRQASRGRVPALECPLPRR